MVPLILIIRTCSATLIVVAIASQIDGLVLDGSLIGLSACRRGWRQADSLHGLWHIQIRLQRGRVVMLNRILPKMNLLVCKDLPLRTADSKIVDL